MIYLFNSMFNEWPPQPNRGGVEGAPAPLGLDVKSPPRLDEEDDLELIDADVDRRCRDERRKRESVEV